MENQENTVDLKDLKIQAYKERVSEQEERIADLRVEITVLSTQLEEAKAKVRELEDNAPQEKD